MTGKQPLFAAPQTRDMSKGSAPDGGQTAKEKRVPLAFGMDQRSTRNS
jgi:hypothetical protein